VRLSVGMVHGVSLEESQRHPADWTPEDRLYVPISVADIFPGRGLGPTIVAAVARDREGGITVHTDASGTVMQLLLPAAPPEAGDAR
jgi:hypothetical protein